MSLPGYDAWKTRSPDDDRRETREDKEMELLDWYAKHARAIDEDFARRQAELDAQYAQAIADLDADYAKEMEQFDE